MSFQVRALAGHWGSVASAAFSPDGKWILSGSSDELVKIWDVATGAQVRSTVGVLRGGGLGFPEIHSHLHSHSHRRAQGRKRGGSNLWDFLQSHCSGVTGEECVLFCAC